MDQQPCNYAVAIAMIYKNRVYMSRRMNTAIYIDKWQFPCGDINEDDVKTIKDIAAEVLESETNLEVNPERLIYVGPVFEDPLLDVCYMYYIKLFDGEIPARVHPNLKSPWYLLKFDIAEKFEVIPGMLKVLRYLKFIFTEQ
jgi:ADP-ribose pyrophosphatase YjhB (NUDIX family)